MIKLLLNERPCLWGKTLSCRLRRRLCTVVDRPGSNWCSTWFGLVALRLKRASLAESTNSATVETRLLSHSAERTPHLMSVCRRWRFNWLLRWNLTKQWVRIEVWRRWLIDSHKSTVFCYHWNAETLLHVISDYTDLFTFYHVNLSLF